MPELATLFQAIQLPAMPEVAHALIRTLDDDDVHASTVRDLIARDPALTAKLLGLANSARFGQSRKISTLDSAISLVGMAQIRTLALSACLHNAFSVPEGLNRIVFWRASMACAAYAQWLAGGLQVDRQTAWLTGMMLRLGGLIIDQYSPQMLQRIEHLPREPGERWERQREAIGFDEGQVTAELARRWNFPTAMTDALGRCAEPLAATPLNRLAAILHLAGFLADSATPDAKALDQLPQPVLSALKIDLDWLYRDLPDSDAFVDLSSL